MITMTLITVVVGAVVTIGVSGANAFRTGAVRNEIETNARRCLDRLSRELLAARRGSINALPETPAWDNELLYDRFDGVSAADGTMSWDPNRIAFEYEAGEVDDGLDNDGDGLIDEGQIVMTRGWGTADPSQVTLCRYVREFAEREEVNGVDDNGNTLVDERGFCLERDGDYLTIRLSVERFDADGRLMTSSLETSIWIRD
jgi:hypothetical protein